MLNYSSTANQTFCREIDEELERRSREYLQISRQLRTKRNSGSITYQLPTEILCSIFRNVAGVDEAIQKKDLYGFIPRISHVCSHWRAIALSDALLWTKIRVNNTRACAERTKELLLRSGIALLSVYCPTYTPCEALSLALGHSERIISLRISACPQSSFQQIGQLLVSFQSWKALRNLELNEISEEHDDMQALSALGSDLGHIFSGALQLQKILIPSLPFNVTSLSSTLSDLTVRSRIDDIQAILAVLRATPNLRSLGFCDLEFPTEVISTFISSGPIDLPLLESLYLQGSDRSCTLLIRCLHVPPLKEPFNVMAEVSLTTWASSEECARALINLTYSTTSFSYFNQGLANLPHDLSLTFHLDEFVSFSTGTDRRHLTFHLHDVPDVQNRALEMCYSMWLTPQVEHLEIVVRDFLPVLSWTAEDWVQTFGDLPNLSRIEIRGDRAVTHSGYPPAHVPGFSAAIGSPLSPVGATMSDSHAPLHQAELAFPALRTLLFSDIAFGSRSAQFSKLMANVSARFERQMVLDELSFIRCTGLVGPLIAQMQKEHPSLRLLA